MLFRSGISPVSPFGLLVVEAFDRGMPVSDWIGFYLYPDRVANFIAIVSTQGRES